MPAQKILLVEDEVWILLDIEQALEDAGFEVVAVNNAADAVARYDAEPASFKGLITDIRVGTGPSGWDIARHLRQIAPPIAVVYISGHGAEEWRSQGVPDSVMIQKPFVMAQIITALSQLLNQTGTNLTTGTS